MAGFLAKKLYNIPFVLTTHSLEPLRAWKSEQLGSGYAMSSWMERTAILEADAIVAVSNGTKADVLRAYDVPAERIHVIYNGIDLNEYQQTADTTALTQYGVDPAIPYVLFVGRITRQKGVTHLVDAIRYLPPETQIVLCAGAPTRRRSPPRCAPKWMRPATTTRTSSGSRRWSPAPRPSSSTPMPGSSAAPRSTNPSASSTLRPWPAAPRWSPAPPGASSKSWSMARPATSCLSSRTPSPASPSHPDQFARDLGAKLTALLKDPVACKRFGEAGRKRVEQHFAWTSIADQTIALYQELIARRKQTSSQR